MSDPLIPIIVDTNVLQTAVTARSIPRWIQELAVSKQEALGQFQIVLVETVLLELMLALDQTIEGLKLDIQTATKTLEKSGAKVDTSDVDVREGFSIVTELNKLGFNVVKEIVTLEDFQEAHRRTCLHQDPKIVVKRPDGSEELQGQFRDLIIYCVALRLAKSKGRAFLVSEDAIFYSPSKTVPAETAEAGLMRVKHLGSCFGISSPQEEALAGVIEEFWPDLRKHITRLAQQPRWDDVEILSVTNGPNVLNRAEIALTMLNESSRTAISARAELMVLDERRVKLKLTSIMYGERGIADFEKVKQVTSIPKAPAYEEDKIQELRDILGGSQ